MWNFSQQLFLQLFLTSSIGFISYIGDIGLENGKTEIVRAISDNLTHAIVGGITWTLVLILLKKSVIENVERIIICFLMSSLIDIDHFILARSWDINDATHLNHRPFLHCTTIPITILIVMTGLSKIMNVPKLIIYAWMIIASFISHHVRDGNRRGLWFWPFGSTPPIPYYFYLMICMFLPYFISWMIVWQMNKNTKDLSFISIV